MTPATPHPGEQGQGAQVASPGAVAIAEERARQMSAEGWTAEHDDEHDAGELARAAACYAMPKDHRRTEVRRMAGSTRSPALDVRVPAAWPWDPEWWKPCPDDRARELVKAGALIAAEIDRLDRASGIAAPAAPPAPAPLPAEGWLTKNLRDPEFARQYATALERQAAEAEAPCSICKAPGGAACDPAVSHEASLPVDPLREAGGEQGEIETLRLRACEEMGADPDAWPWPDLLTKIGAMRLSEGERTDERDAALARLAALEAQPLPVVPAPGEGLTLECLLRTAVQVALTNYEADEDLNSGMAEDRAVERVHALLTPAGRLSLAAELLEPLGLVDVTMTSASFAALAAGQVVHERIDGHEYHRHATLLLGKVRVHIGETRPATLDDARRLLEEK